MGCAKESDKAEVFSIVKSANEYGERVGTEVNSIIDSCLNGSSTIQESKLNLATLLNTDTRGLKIAFQDLETKTNSGREVSRISMNLRSGRSLTISFKDGKSEKYVIVNGKAYFDDGKKVKSPTEVYGRKDQGQYGEAIVSRIAVNELDLYGVHFDPPEHGLDGAFEDNKGNLVLVEAKLADAGLGALGNPAYGAQGSPEWVAECARRMQTPGSDMYSINNAELGARIENIGPENVRFITISTDPQTRESTGYERQSDGSWKQIGNWDTRQEGE